VGADPLEEPLDDAEGDEEGDDKTDDENDPAMGVHEDGGEGGVAASGDTGLVPAQDVKIRPEALDEIVEGGGDHRGDGDEETEFEGGRTSHAGELAGGDGGHGTRGSWKDGGSDLAEADPNGLKEGHLLDIGDRSVVADAPRIDDPHNDAADDEGIGDGAEALKMRTDDIGEQERWDRGADKSREGEGEGMVPDGVLAVFTAGKGADKFDDAAGKEQGESEDGAELDDDGVHLPVGIVEADLEERFADAQMGCGTDGEEFGEALDDPEKYRDHVIVQAGSGLGEELRNGSRRLPPTVFF